MNRALSTSERVFAQGGQILNVVGASVLPVLTLLIVADIVTRKLLIMPLKGVLEITEIGLVLVVFLSFAHTYVVRGHVATDFLTRRFAPSARTIIDTLTQFMAVGVFGIFVYAAVSVSIETWQDDMTTMALRIPLFPFKFAIACGVFAMWLLLLIDWIRTSSQAILRSGKHVSKVVSKSPDVRH